MYHVKFVYLFVCLIGWLFYSFITLFINSINLMDFTRWFLPTFLPASLPPFLPLLSYTLLYSILLYSTMFSNSNVFCPSFVLLSSPPSLNYPLTTILHISHRLHPLLNQSLSPFSPFFLLSFWIFRIFWIWLRKQRWGKHGYELWIVKIVGIVDNHAKSLSVSTCSAYSAVEYIQYSGVQYMQCSAVQ